MSIFDHPHRRFSRGFTLLALLAFLVLTAVALSQCRQIGDSIAGVDLAGSSPALHPKGDCPHRCNEDYKAARTAEDERHEAALESCAGDADCIAEENRLHRDLQRQIQKALQNCKRNCYNEGGGSGGH